MKIEQKILSGCATFEELASIPPDDIFAIKAASEVHHICVFEKAHGVDKDSRTVIGTPISTEAVDRYGDIIRVKGWELGNFKKNPVLLFGHNNAAFSIEDTLPIGKVLKPRKGAMKSGGKALLADEQFFTADLNPKAELVWKMVAANALPARSVGFLPLPGGTKRPKDEAERVKMGVGEYGVEYTSHELLENSVVPIPANQEALQGKAMAAAREVIKANDFSSECVEWFRKSFPLTEGIAESLERELRRSMVVVKKPEEKNVLAPWGLAEDGTPLPVEPKYVECPACGHGEARWHEAHADCDGGQNAMVIRCPSCGVDTDPDDIEVSEVTNAPEVHTSGFVQVIGEQPEATQWQTGTLVDTVAAERKALTEATERAYAQLASIQNTVSDLVKLAEKLSDVLDRVEDAFEERASNTGTTRAEDPEAFQADLEREFGSAWREQERSRESGTEE